MFEDYEDRIECYDISNISGDFNVGSILHLYFYYQKYVLLKFQVFSFLFLLFQSSTYLKFFKLKSKILAECVIAPLET